MTCPPSSRWLLLGDSYAVGMSSTLKDHAYACGIQLSTEAKVGTNVSQWAGWAEPIIARQRPDYVLISQGGNDFGRTWAADKVSADIGQLLGIIKKHGARPLWISPPTTPFPDAIGARQMWWSRIRDDGFDSTSLDIPRVPDDPLGHPSAAGYRQWADAIWVWASARATAKQQPIPPHEPVLVPSTYVGGAPFALGSLIGFAASWALTRP